MSPESLRGNCHCGNFRFTLSANLGDVFTCGCTLCSKLGCIWLRSTADGFAVARDEGSLVEYQGVKFCGKCGTPVMGEHLVGPLRGEVLVNARAMWGFNPFGVGAIERVAAAAEGEKKVEPLDVESGAVAAIHHGSCRCGKVRVELLVDIAELEVKEDNCSSCVRNAYIGIYPTKDQVRIHGRENTFEYLYGRKFNGAVHCKTCGALVFNNVYGPPISVFDSLPPERKEVVLAIYWKNMAMQPLNVRTLDNVDIQLLEVKRTDEGTEGYALPD
ncbi:hypothetical protein QBC34DRAFT_488382 [Podospora aff. communis PSN243]|uniref:CENP-V/GFA domain-containing protein n=1 Tax=Podospora aff. communis PSN243 TaxID=3040156 RepID=A0AAV9G5K6_9PEZI|nr:hypothetical protein QBC34DRAFT_488382 [Podospora aff. communis PSN243]